MCIYTKLSASRNKCLAHWWEAMRVPLSPADGSYPRWPWFESLFKSTAPGKSPVVWTHLGLKWLSDLWLHKQTVGFCHISFSKLKSTQAIGSLKLSRRLATQNAFFVLPLHGWAFSMWASPGQCLEVVVLWQSEHPCFWLWDICPRSGCGSTVVLSLYKTFLAPGSILIPSRSSSPSPTHTQIQGPLPPPQVAGHVNKALFPNWKPAINGCWNLLEHVKTYINTC